MLTSFLYLKEHPIKGKCVHLSVACKNGDLIDVNHVITYPFLPEGHKLLDWSMEWTETEDALALGLMNLLNHSSNSNCYLINDYETKTKRLYAKRDLLPDEELTITYACELWFEEEKNQ